MSDGFKTLTEDEALMERLAKHKQTPIGALRMHNNIANVIKQVLCYH